MKFLKQFLSLIIFLLCITGFINGQSVEEIITKHIKAHGGEKKWSAIKSMELTGKYTAFSDERDIYAFKTNTGTYYSVLNIAQHKITEAFNGESGWTIDPWHDFSYPRLLSKSEVNVFYQKAEFFSPFYQYKERGIKVELIGTEKIDGVETYAIKVVRPNDFEETWYLNQETYLEVKSVSTWIDFAVPLSCESFYDDFRTVEGLVIPFNIERMFGQRDHIIKIETLKFNTSIDEAVFLMPRSEGMAKLAPLEGEWNVVIDRWRRNKTWGKTDETISNIEFEATNMITQKLNFEDYYVQNMIVNYSFHEPSGKYRLMVYSDFTSTMRMFEGSFASGVLTVENTNILYGDAEASKTSMQLCIYDITENGFVMELKRSADKGETWNPKYKFTYTKK